MPYKDLEKRREKNRHWRKANPNYHRNYMSNIRLNYPEKYRSYISKEKTVARQALNNAVKTGYLVKPNKCMTCVRTIKIEGHHPDYLKPLEVVWLCKYCHEKIHIKRA